jgi:hypothetical protein
MSTKKGPQGQAILSSLSELTVLDPTLREHIGHVGGQALTTLMEENLIALDVLEAVKPKTFLGYFSIAA